MDAVILAAGRNQRLASYIPDFNKPLIAPLITHGERAEPLVRQAVQHARWQGVDRPVVVASSGNAAMIDYALKDLSADIVIQRSPDGPGDALRIGLSLNVGKPHEKVLVLLADNLMSDDDVAKVTSMSGIGVRQMYPDEANQFTWYDPDQKRWREKEQVPNRFAHGVDCWVGPFVGYREDMDHVLRHALPINGEYAIGPYLNELTRGAAHVFVRSIDIGTPETYLAYLRGEL